MANHQIDSLVLFSILAFRSVSGMISTIRHGEETNETLESPCGTFSLGFFNMGDTGLGYWGIWYTGDIQKTKVWVANPNMPLSNNSATLSVDTDGVLKIVVNGRAVLNISDQVSG